MRFLPFILLALYLGTALLPGADWRIYRHDGREYVSARNVAQFYSLPRVIPARNEMRLDGGRNHIVLAKNSREAYINGVKHWLNFPVIERNGDYLISRFDLAKTVEPLMRPHLARNLGRVQTVVIDPGHGGHDKGAQAPFALEKDLALDVAKRLGEQLRRRGYRVVFTRERDVFVPLEERARMANRHRNALFVSIHFNGASNRNANGFEVFSLTPRGAPSQSESQVRPAHLQEVPGHASEDASFVLANIIHHSLVGQGGLADRGVKRARFAVLRHAKMPSVLVECGFLSNTQDARQAASTAWRTRLASAIADGIDNYRNVAERRQMPRQVADYRRGGPGSVTIRDATRETDAPRVVVPTGN